MEGIILPSAGTISTGCGVWCDETQHKKKSKKRSTNQSKKQSQIKKQSKKKDGTGGATGEKLYDSPEALARRITHAGWWSDSKLAQEMAADGDEAGGWY
jgi:hypothetical protein